jgi:hypothetical protein
MRTHVWTIVAALLVLIFAVATLGFRPSPAQAATPAQQGEVSVDIAPLNSSVLRPGQDLQVTVSITNGTDESLPPGAVELHLAERPLSSRTAVDLWLHPAEAGGLGDLMLSQPTTAQVPPGETETLVMAVPAASVPLTPADGWGPRGIAAAFNSDQGIQGDGRSVIVWYTSASVTPVDLSVAMPITTPAGTTGLITATALETYTSPTGLLTRQLDGVINRPVALAVDPMIIASIRILGSSAPPSALDWLARLEQVTNEIFPLSYADADLALQAQAGSAQPLAPLSFDPLIDADLFSESASPITDEPVEGTPLPVSPTPAPRPLAPPTSEDLLAWDYTFTSLAWPAEGTVHSGDLAVFAAGGLETTILSESNVSRSDSAVTHNSVITLGAYRGLVSDDRISASIREAVRATTDQAWHAAIAEAVAQLAAVSLEEPGTSRALLVSFDRGWPSTATRLSQTVDALAGVPWHAAATLTQAMSAPPATDVVLADKTEPQPRLTEGRRLLDRESEISAFSSALEDPSALTAPHRLDMLALFATAWMPNLDAWTDAVGTNLTSSREVLHSVTVTTQGPINVVGSQVDIPVTLSNSLQQAVTVRVRVIPSNGRLVVGGDVESTVDAQSARTVKVPVTAAVGNGDVSLRVSLLTPSGVPVDDPSLIAVNVRADWEGFGSLAFAIFVVVFFGFGVWRNIARRRRERSSEQHSAAGPDEGAGGSTGAQSRA